MVCHVWEMGVMVHAGGVVRSRVCFVSVIVTRREAHNAL